MSKTTKGRCYFLLYPLGEGAVVVIMSSSRPYSLASSADMKKSRSVSLAIFLDRLAGVLGVERV